MKPKGRRRRLVEKGGVEMFELRIVRYFSPDGRVWHAFEATTEDGPIKVPVHELLGALEVTKAMILENEEYP